jgi:hypothetical protein
MSGPYVKVMNGKEYISSTVLFIRAKISSEHIMNSQVAMILSAMVTGLFVATTRPAKKDCEIPIYNNGTI